GRGSAVHERCGLELFGVASQDRVVAHQLPVCVGGDDRGTHCGENRGDGDAENDQRGAHLGELEARLRIPHLGNASHFTLTWSKTPYIACTNAMATKPTMRPTKRMSRG